MKYRHLTRLALLLLLASALTPVLIGQTERAYAAPKLQDDPAEQCAEGVRLFQSGDLTAAGPLLEAGFAGRERATFAQPDDLGFCAVMWGQMHNNSDFNSALEAYAVALEIFHRTGNREFEGISLNNIGVVYSSQARYADALEALQQALTIIRTIGDRASEGGILNNIGEVYNNQARYADALESYQQALMLIRAIGDRASEGIILNNISTIYMSQGRYADALEASQQALVLERAAGDRPNEGTTLSNIGALYTSQARYADALEALQQALAIRREVGDRVGEGTTLSNIGVVYHNQARYADALESYQQALVIQHAIGDRASEASTLNNIGEIYHNQARYADALESHQQALAIRRVIGDRAGEGTTLDNIGQIYHNQARYADALESYQQALAIRRAIGDRAGEGTTLNNIGGIYNSQGRYGDALESYQQALAIDRAIGDRAGEGATLNNIGTIHNYQGRYGDALESCQQALAIRRAIGDRAGEGATLNNIGEIYRQQGRYGDALESYQQALAIEHAIGDRAGEGATLNNFGHVYMSQARYGDALGSYQQALAIRRAIGDRAGEAFTLSNIGQIYHNQGRYGDALESHQQALAIDRAIGDRAGEGATLNNFGHVYMSQARYGDALESYQQALAIERAIGDRAGEGSTLNNIGEIYRQQGRYGDALESYQQALAIEHAIGDRAGEGTTLSNIGLIYKHQGQFNRALVATTQAMDVLEALRASAGSEAGRAGFIAYYAEIYQRAALLYHRQHQDDLAFLVSERGRARAFLDSLATGSVQLSDQTATALLTQEHETYAARQAAQDALAKARAANPPDTALIADLDQQLKDAATQYTAALAAIEQSNSQLADLVPGRTSGALGVADVQKLLAPQTTLVSFFLGAEQTLVFILTHQRFQTVVLPVGQSALRDQVQALLDSPAFQQAAYPAEAVTLYTTLIAPLKQYLNTPHLAIMPHQALHYLPFAALTDGRRYLADDYVLSVLPSGSALPFIQTNTGRPAAPPLILGNPATGQPDLAPLPFAEQEAQAVASLYDVQPLLEQQATEAELRARAAQAGILHLAAHGRYDPVVPLASLLALAPGNESSPDQDGRLEASEIYSLNLKKTDLVVLSACQTSLGDVSAGDEVVGLTRAFFFAGTPTVVSSLWSVDDEATGLLMERFYTHLRAGLGKAAALRQAQLDVRAQYPAPYYWAGFVLAGDAGTLPAEGGWRWVALGVVLTMVMVGMAGALLWLNRRLIPDGG